MTLEGETVRVLLNATERLPIDRFSMTIKESRGCATSKSHQQVAF